MESGFSVAYVRFPVCLSLPSNTTRKEPDHVRFASVPQNDLELFCGQYLRNNIPYKYPSRQEKVTLLFIWMIIVHFSNEHLWMHHCKVALRRLQVTILRRGWSTGSAPQKPTIMIILLWRLFTTSMLDLFLRLQIRRHYLHWGSSALCYVKTSSM